MKGIIIYESPFMGFDYVRAVNLNNAEYKFELRPSEDAEATLSGSYNKSAQAKCSKEDTYDFETGALISLMRLCGVDKVKKAAKETFFDVAENSVNEYEEKIYALEEEIKRLKGEGEKRWKNYQRNIQKKQDRINELQAQIKDSEDDKQKNIEYYEKEIKDLKKNIDELFEDDKYWKADHGRLSFEKHRLEEKVEKLKLDNEKLQKGYIDTDMIFCGGRQNGKQHTFLVDLFKKIDQKRVDAAYKEAYNTTLPVWQKEFLKQAYEIRKESKEKTELPRTLDINGVKYRECNYKESPVWFTSQPERLSFHANYIDTDALEALRGSQKKPISKREKMWDEILKEGRTPIYVKREDIRDFLEECQVVGIKWSSGKSPLETMPYHMSEGYDGVYFFVMTTLDIAGTLSTAKRGVKEFRHVMSWWCTACPDEVEAAIHYIRPMRWDLFEKGRLAVKLDNHNYREFCTKCESKIGRKPRYAFNYGPFTVYYKDGVFHSRPYDEKIPYKYHIVDWEDVR